MRWRLATRADVERLVIFEIRIIIIRRGRSAGTPPFAKAHCGIAIKTATINGQLLIDLKSCGMQVLR